MDKKGSNNDIESGLIDQKSLCFEDLRFKLHAKSGESKELLHGINGLVREGETLAIMGPSGAGKTTLLDLLTLEYHGGEPSGKVSLHGNPFSHILFRKVGAYVPQYDVHWAFLTPRETIFFAAQFLVPKDSDTVQEKVNSILDKMGLQDCADTKVGNTFLRGISGGQQRRLSLAVALVKSPLVVFMDEPTSGLDAAAAAKITSFLKECTQQSRVISVMTIHQPSSQMFSEFDQVMVLSAGRVAYCGPAEAMSVYLESIGSPVPPRMNPADFVLSLVNKEFSDPKQVHELLELWNQNSHAKSIKQVVAANIDSRSRFLERTEIGFQHTRYPKQLQ
eukprot:gene7160-8538_t